MSAGTCFNPEKLDQVLLFFVEKAGGSLPSVTLLKLLYYADFHSQARRDRPITGATYRAWEDGPVCVMVLRDWDSDTQPATRRVWENETRWISARPGVRFDTGSLTQDEMQILAGVWDEFGRLSGRELSARTHREAPWRITWNMAGSDNEVIPLDYAYEEYGGDREVQEDREGDVPPPPDSQAGREAEEKSGGGLQEALRVHGLRVFR